MAVYLLHFDRPLKHARHYLGFATQVKRRVAHHRAGTGARLTQVLKEQGIGFTVVRVWEGGDRALERRLKNRKNSSRLCPVCRAMRAGAGSDVNCGVEKAG